MGPELIGALITLTAKYGPDLVAGLVSIWHKSHGEPVTVADVEQAFTRLKDYDAYNIPDPAPAAPAIVSTSSPTPQ